MNGSDFDWGVGGTFGVRSSIALNPPYIVVHGSTGFCLLTGSVRSWSWSAEGPLGLLIFCEAENLRENLRYAHVGQSFSPLRGDVALHEERWRKAGIGGYQVSLRRQDSLLLCCVALSKEKEKEEEKEKEKKKKKKKTRQDDDDADDDDGDGDDNDKGASCVCSLLRSCLSLSCLSLSCLSLFLFVSFCLSFFSST